ncbi:uncharacterized protein LOC110860200 [Folsomia candida]|uniref:uncharacterized protein LOC110860200 n=1 Tax=Folsomia candida TaxID=158441 RepID=UPI000B900653|nr:uncharacterized protein LOC110860200 [Folsomia candida]
MQEKFPKEFNEVTRPNIKGYPLYRRRRGTTVQVRGATMDNRYVVPYSPYLLLKYNAHINIEVCTSLLAVKYIYKYIYKGFDCASIAITSEGQPQLRYNEIDNYINGRYLSAPEAMWRLLEFKMHDRSHAVMKLPFHLPNQQRIRFEEGREEEALLAAQTGRTKLESWFHLNTNDPDAQQFLYTEIPLNYVYVKGNWQKRQRGGNKFVVRMYPASLKDEENYYLRLLLLHVRGATSYESVRTFNSITYSSFKEAAMARGLLESDEEWDRCLSEASIFQMPKQLRETFCYICCFCQPAKPLDLWTKFQVEMSLDYSRNRQNDDAVNMALHDIDEILQQHGLSCTKIGLPEPTGQAPQEECFNPILEAQLAEERIGMLNANQRDAFNGIVRAIDNAEEPERAFYVDGPGGSGKTFLYTTLLSFVRGRSQVALPFATTGIAATLLKGGRTAHSGFKLEVPLSDTSVSGLRPSSKDADVLRQASLILIDEITMLSKHGLRCIDRLLREVMSCKEKPFGGKVIVIRGDFRQTLPVVPRGSRAQILEC